MQLSPFSPQTSHCTGGALHSAQAHSIPPQQAMLSYVHPCLLHGMLTPKHSTCFYQLQVREQQLFCSNWASSIRAIAVLPPSCPSWPPASMVFACSLIIHVFLFFKTCLPLHMPGHCCILLCHGPCMAATTLTHAASALLCSVQVLPPAPLAAHPLPLCPGQQMRSAECTAIHLADPAASLGPAAGLATSSLARSLSHTMERPF